MNEGALKEEIFRVTKVLKDGGVILYPTDTIWGIGCDARNEAAVQRIYQLKNRAEEKSMLILVDNENRLNRYVKSIPEAAWDLIEYSDKPLTIVFDGAMGVSPSIISVDGSLGVRVVKEGFCHRMLHRFGHAVVSTSANISGEPSPTSFGQISAQIKASVDYVVGESFSPRAGKPSTIIKLTSDSKITILRE
jgi:L-threonylcarbamoyladenylate synthase